MDVVIREKDLMSLVNLKQELDAKLEPFRNVVVNSADDVPDAKKKRAEVNKLFKEVEDERKKVQKLVGEFTNQFTPVIKFVIDDIDAKIEVIEGAERDAKFKEIKKCTNDLFKELELTKYYNWKVLDFEIWWSNLFDPRWLNKTHTTWEQELKDKLVKIKSDIELLTLTLGYKDINDYLLNLDLNASIQARKQIPIEVLIPAQTEDFVANVEARTLRVVCDNEKYKLLVEFMVKNSIIYKEV